MFHGVFLQEGLHEKYMIVSLKPYQQPYPLLWLKLPMLSLTPKATAIIRLNLIYLRFQKIILIQNNRLTKMNILVQQLPVDK